MSVVDLGSILKYSSNIEIGQRASIVQAQSQSGKRVAQRRGPVLYTMKMTGLTYRVDSDEHVIMRTIIIALNYGANTIRFNLKNSTTLGICSEETHKTESTCVAADGIWTPAPTSGSSPTRLLSTGTWGGSPVINGAGQIGKSLNIKGCEDNVAIYNYTGDYLQFEGNDKVYQIAGRTSTSNNVNDWLGYSSTGSAGSANVPPSSFPTGETTIYLNTPLVKSPLDGSDIVVGDDVQFHMSMDEMPTVTYLPGDLVQFGDMNFEEIIAD